MSQSLDEDGKKNGWKCADLSTHDLQQELYHALHLKGHPDDCRLVRSVELASELGARGEYILIRENEVDSATYVIQEMGRLLLTKNQSLSSQFELVMGMAALAAGERADAKLKIKLNAYLAKSLLDGTLSWGIISPSSQNLKQETLLGSVVVESAIHDFIRHEWSHARRKRRLESERRKNEEWQEKLKQAEESRERKKLEKERRLYYLQPMRKIELWMTTLQVSPVQAAPHLRDRDVELIFTWANKSNQYAKNLPFSEAARALGKWDFTRLFSARMSELAAIEFYERCGSEVCDVSIEQIGSGAPDWRTHDLNVDGRPVDVKAARQSYSNKYSYSEFMVPSFKEARNGLGDVSVVSVFAEYLRDSRILEGETPECVVLGEVKQKDLDDVTSWLESSFGGLIRVGYLGADSRLPGWCFEYLDKVTRSFEDIQQKIVDFFGSAENRPGKDLFWASKLFLLFFDDAPWPKDLFSETSDYRKSRERETLGRELVCLRHAIGWSRRTIFLFVIAYTLKKAKESSEAWSPSMFHEWLWVSDSLYNGERQTRWPLGLYDPLGYIGGIVRSMEVLWRTSRNQLGDFSYFRLVSPWILIGKSSQGKDITLMAYCGGWTKVGSSRLTKCGNSPLVLGKNVNCPHCGRLVCDVCGFCSPRCVGLSERLSESPPLF